MNDIPNTQQKNTPLSVKKEDEKSIKLIQKKEKLLGIGIYSLIILITIALMLILYILFNK